MIIFLPINLGLLLALTSLIFLGLGAHLLIDGAVDIATALGLSHAVIGLTLVAVGTSIPELFTVIVASAHKEPDIVIGNILGSNLFNILSILGITALFKPIPFIGQIASQDIWILLIASLFLLAMIKAFKQLTRKLGLMLVVLYAAYIIWLFCY